MMYRIIFSREAFKQLKKLDKHTQKQIQSYINANVNYSENPRLHGKALGGDLKNLWRYRVGDYRIICRIEDNVCEVLVVKIGHRKDVYE